MQVRWTEPASEDLTTIGRYIARDKPDAARNVAKTIYDGCMSLENAPYKGRPGRTPGTRELVFSGLPYLAVYRQIGGAVEILRIWHGAQRR